jgi:PhnB protein
LSNQTARFVHKVIPMLVCRDAAAEIAFCEIAFGAEELSRRAEDGVVVHALLRIGADLVMVHGETAHLASRSPEADGSSSVVIYLYIEDVDGVVKRALAAGARVLTEVQDQFWGDRMGRIIDPAGHVWNIATRAEV